MHYTTVVTKATLNTQRKLISTIVRKELCKKRNLLMRTDEPKMNPKLPKLMKK